MRVLDRLANLRWGGSRRGGRRVRGLVCAPVCWRLAVCAVAALVLVGCRSRFVAATIENDTAVPLRMVELDYPGASFGISTLAPRAVYSYRFKALGSGPLGLIYSEAGGGAHTVAGPVVKDGQGGSLAVHIRERGVVSWEPVFDAR